MDVKIVRCFVHLLCIFHMYKREINYVNVLKKNQDQKKFRYDTNHNQVGQFPDLTLRAFISFQNFEFIENKN